MQDRSSSSAVLIFVLFVNLFILGEVVTAGQAHTANPIKVTTRYTKLVFNNSEDRLKFYESIDFPKGDSLTGLFSSPKPYEIEQDLVRKVDLLFEKVQAILDMRKKMRKVRVRLVSNKNELQENYQKIYKTKGTVRGWYVYDFNTVYLNVQDVHEGMLAHELGHAIIDHYLSVRPPRATAEILAKYVDKHLFEEVKKY